MELEQEIERLIIRQSRRAYRLGSWADKFMHYEGRCAPLDHDEGCWSPLYDSFEDFDSCEMCTEDDHWYETAKCLRRCSENTANKCSTCTQKLDHETKFEAFMQWAKSESSPTQDRLLSLANIAPYAVQLVKQVNFGPQVSVRYFAPAENGLGFVELAEHDLLEWNFEKLNSYVRFIIFLSNLLLAVSLIL